MKLGYYFHLPAYFLGDDRVAVPSWHGMFIAEIAERAGNVVYFAHPARERTIEDMELRPPRVVSIDAGPERSAPLLTFLPKVNLDRIRDHMRDLDALIVRGPTPFLPALAKSVGDIPLVVLMVADYSMWQPDSLEPLWRAWLIRRWVAAYERMQARVLRRALVLPISSAYTRRLERRFPNVQTIFTSSLRAADVMSESEAAGWRWDPAAGRDRPATLIYTGRLVEEKGILDAIVAVAELKRRGWLVQLVLVGWWPDPDFESVVRKRAADYGVADSIRSEGYVPSGEALMKIYRSADIYIHPTRNEGGVARSLKEAMAAHIPTVTTKIMVMDEELQDGGQTMLVEPSSPSALAAAIERLLADGDLAARVAAGGWQWARKRTNEESCALILDLVTGWVREKTRP